MVDADSVLNFIKSYGPVIPRYVVKELGADTFIIGAILSTLANEKKLKITHTKFGGTPMYYLPEHEAQIQRLYDFLHEKEKKAFDMLKEKKIVKDTTLPPVFRVAMRNIKDFARPLEVNIKGQKELFWKWYLFPTSQAAPIIKQLLQNEVGKIQPKIDVHNKVKISKKIEEQIQKPNEIIQKEESHQKAIQKERTNEKIKKEEIKVEKEEQKTIKKIETTEDSFLEKIRKKFSSSGVEIYEEEIIKKNSEIDLIISFSSPIGKLKFYCKARNKKRINDKDISSAIISGNNKKLPLVFLTSGELTKKTNKMLDNEFKGTHVYYI